ncbi:MAG TPA: hypothetical protein VES42_07955, partial [Pilimelia sp.]|nr:hypothetical protein [Pilimelia sp.]
SVRPLLDGTGVRAPSTDPARVRSHAIGAGRTPLVIPAAELTPAATGAATARVCAQVAAFDDAATCAVRGQASSRSPHFVGFYGLPSEPDRHAVALDWSAPGGAVSLPVAGPTALAGAQAVALRLAVPPNSVGTALDVAVVDGAGRRATLGQVTVDGLPGTMAIPAQWGQEVRVPLAAATAAGLDLGRVTALELTPRGAAGRAWLVDAWGWRAGTPTGPAAPLPRIDIGDLSDVQEGDTGVRTYQLPVTVSGSGTGRVRLFVVSPFTQATSHQVVAVAPGTTRFTVPIPVSGNTRFGSERLHYVVLAKAMQGTVVGGYEGSLGVLNDDPRPAPSVSAVTDRVTEGASLTWRVALSAPADVALSGRLTPQAPAAGAELSTTDVDADWLKSALQVEAAPSRPLSAAGGTLTVTVAPGAREAVIEVKTAADGTAEPAEQVRLSLDWSGQRVDLTGTVTDAP